jgi:hypothetical protein
MVSQKVSTGMVRFRQLVAVDYKVRWDRVKGRNVRLIAPRTPCDKVNLAERKRFAFRSDRPLALDFSRVRGEKELEEFCERYGELGYRTQFRALQLRGEPVEWCLWHSKTAAGLLSVMAIVQDIRRGRYPLNDSSAPHIAASLQRAFNGFGVTGPHFKHSKLQRQARSSEKSKKRNIVTDPPTDKMFFTLEEPRPFAHHVEVGFVWVENWTTDPLNGTDLLIQALINPMIDQFYPRLAKELNPQGLSPLQLQLVCQSLIGAIYWQLAESLGGTFRSCKRCLRVFPVNGKQQFCSPSCMNRVKCEKYRESHKQAERKPTNGTG